MHIKVPFAIAYGDSTLPFEEEGSGSILIIATKINKLMVIITVISIRKL